MKPFRMLVWFGGILAFGTALGILDGCTPPASAQEAAAEAAYAAQHLRCVDESKTLEESRECRRRVREAWGIHETVRDGGAR